MARSQGVIPASLAQSTVLSLRNLLEDIAAWGWAEAPTGRADILKLDRPCHEHWPQTSMPG